MSTPELVLVLVRDCSWNKVESANHHRLADGLVHPQLADAELQTQKRFALSVTIIPTNRKRVVHTQTKRLRAM